MAIERKQKLVNLHTSAMTEQKLVDLKSALEFGEIAIKYAPDSPTIYTKVKDSGETVSLAEFIDKAAVKALINAEGVDALKTRVSTLEGLHASTTTTVAQEVEAGINALNATVSQSAGTDGLALQVVETNGKLVSVSGSIAANTYDEYGAASSAKTEIVGTASTAYDNLGKVQAKIVAEASARETADEALQSNIDAIYKAGGGATEESGVLVDKINDLDATVTGENSTKQIKVEVVEENGKLASVSVTAGALEVSGAAATAKSELLGDAGEDYNTLGKLEDKIQAEATRADDVEKEISGNVTTIQNQLDGFTTDKGSVKTYVDNKVVGLLHFRGTVHVDGQTKRPALPDITTTAVTHGDVYNVVEEFIYADYKYPAGTNVVAIKLSGETVLDEPYWDALGGTVDLEPYAKKQESAADTKDTMSVAGAKLYAKDLNDSMDTRVDALEADMPGVKAAVGTLTGDTDVTGSVKQQIKAAKDIIDAYTVNGHEISVSPVLNGEDIKLNGYSIASAAAAIGTGDTVNVAIGKLEYKVNANTSAITSEVTRATGVENTLLALHADATSGKKSVAIEVSEGISGISAVTKNASSCGASVSVTTQSGSVSAVTFDLTAIEINCGEF